MAIRPPQINMPPGMTASAPQNSIKYYVLARSQQDFLVWVKGLDGKVKLQDCNYIGTIAGMQGLCFASPEVELVALPKYFEGKGDEFFQEAARLISKYCLDKRVHDCTRGGI